MARVRGCCQGPGYAIQLLRTHSGMYFYHPRVEQTGWPLKKRKNRSFSLLTKTHLVVTEGLISLSARPSACVAFVAFTDCETCRRQISTNTGSIEASEHGLARGPWCVARRLELVAVAGLMWILFCIMGAAYFFVLCSLDFVFLRPHTVCCKLRPPCPIFFSTNNDTGPSYRSDRGRFIV